MDFFVNMVYYYRVNKFNTNFLSSVNLILSNSILLFILHNKN